MHLNRPSTAYRHRYVIGDLQGCFAALQCLLQRLDFDPQQDFIFFAGDLVARGEDSLACLRMVKQLCDQGAAATVLGNHDLNLIACARGIKAAKAKDQTQAILDAADADQLIHWLRKQPLLIAIDDNYLLTHAGIPPIWAAQKAKQLALEVEQVLAASEARLDQFLAAMYGSQPDLWSEHLSGDARLRVITNYLTRMRVLDAEGRMEFSFKQGLMDAMPAGFAPWFSYPHAIQPPQQLLFGHWAALQGQTSNRHCIALDGGCVWGGVLMALQLDSGNIISVNNPLIG